MGGNIQKGKSAPNQQNQETPKPKLMPDQEEDYKQVADLGNHRWFYSTAFKNWEFYYLLTEEEKKNVVWNVFPIEKSYEIERAYINKFTYEKDGQFIFFDNFLNTKHIMMENIDDSMVYSGIVRREEPNNIKNIKNLSRFDTSNVLNYFDNECNDYEYNLLNNLSIVGYEKIFSFFQISPQDKMIGKFLSTKIICNQKLSQFLNGEYQEYIKENCIKYKTLPFNLDILKNMLLFDFKNEEFFMKYYLVYLNKKNFKEIMIKMFLEPSEFNKQIIEFSTKCCKKNINYTTYYLCLLCILYFMNKDRDDWDKNTKGGKSYIYVPKNENILKKNFFENNYYFSPNLLITSKNKFNKINLIDKNIKKNFDEIEIRIPKKYCEINYHPLFNNYEYDVENYSLYNERNIIFPLNSIFKCLNVDSKKGKVILEFAYYSYWNPLLFINKENKKRFNVVEDGFKYLTDEQRTQIYFSRVRNKEAKLIGGLVNIRELEIFDDNEPKTDIKSMICYFNAFKKLNCLTIVGNNMMNRECAKLSEAMVYLKELKILNLSFNSLTDNNIAKITFDANNKIEVLNLKSNNITDTGMETFKNELLKLKNLKEINLYDNQFGDQGMKMLISVLQTLKNLKKLTIPNCGITKVGIEFLADCFENNGGNNTFMENLESLDLMSNPFGDECEKNLIKIFSSLKSLKKYNIGQTQMSRFSRHKIFIALHKKNKNWYFDLVGGWNKISSTDLYEDYIFANIIKDNESPLKFQKLSKKWPKKNAKKYQNKLYFDFSECNLTDNDIPTLLEYLKFFPNIKGFNLSFCPKITIKSYFSLSSSLKNLTNLTQINLSSNDINDEAVKNICKFFDKDSKLNKIDFSWNNITSNGFTTLVKNISSNKLKIIEINICGNKINDDGYKAFTEEVKVGTFNYLNKINFSRNLLGDESMYLFFSFFNYFVNLNEIDFSYNNITDNGVINFSSVINDLVDNISYINISNNKLSAALKCFFEELGIPFNVIY